MKAIRLFIVASLLALGLSSCESVHVATDYDQTTDFNQYKTFAFYKPGIDKANISDLDKRRILRAIDTALTAKGLQKSDNPDLLVGIFTETAQNVNVYQNYYNWGYYGWYDPFYWGYGPSYYGAYNSVSTSTEGTLYINLIDASKKILVWQGSGTGALIPGEYTDEKVKRINTIVQKILDRYPPGTKTSKQK